MSRRAAGLVLIAALLVVGLAAWWWLSGRRPSGRSIVSTPGPRVKADKVELNLYFPSDGGRLRPQLRTLPLTDVPKQRVRAIVEALLAGPQGEEAGLYPLFPEGVAVGSIQLGADGTAYVDLRSPGLETPPPTGSTAEMQIVYSLVDSVVWNVQQVRQVVLLWNGIQPQTFCGHIDTSGPLIPDRSLVAGAPPNR